MSEAKRYSVSMIYDDDGKAMNEVPLAPPQSGRVHERFRHVVLASDYDALRAEVASLKAERYVSVGWQYQFPSPYGDGRVVWRESCVPVNGNKPSRSREIFARATGQQQPSPASDSHLRGSHPGCNYLAEPGTVCRKCGAVVPEDKP